MTVNLGFKKLNAISRILTIGRPASETVHVKEMREDFLSVASHELKTPLTSLKLQVQLISRIAKSRQPQALQPEKLQALAESADRQITRMTHLINSLLEASRLRAERLALEPEDFDINEAVESEVARFRTNPAFDGIELRLRSDGMVRGFWDRGRVEQVLRSLLSNAACFGMNRPIEISVTADGHHASVSVQDQGIGISEEDQKRIFDLFERGVPAAHFGGLGLGLYIANQIAIAHGGEIAVRSRVGKGSTFTLKVPLRVPALRGRSTAA